MYPLDLVWHLAVSAQLGLRSVVSFQPLAPPEVLSKVAVALSDEVQLRALLALCEAPAFAVDLATAFNEPPALVAAKLAQLELLGLVTGVVEESSDGGVPSDPWYRLADDRLALAIHNLASATIFAR